MYKVRKKRHTRCLFRGFSSWINQDLHLIYIGLIIVNAVSISLAQSINDTSRNSNLESTAIILSSTNRPNPTTTIPRKTSKDLLKPHLRTMIHQTAGAPRAIHVDPVLTDGTNLRLNVTWKPPKGPIIPKEYTIEVKSINNTASCKIGFCYATVNGTTNWGLVPELATDEHEHHIKLGCTYKIKLAAHPSNGNSSEAVTEFTIPDCVEGMCSCEHKYNISRPIMKSQYINETFVNVTWTYVNSSAIEHELNLYIIRIFEGQMNIPLSKPIVRYVPHLKGTEESFILINTGLFKNAGDHLIKVEGRDKRNCSWPEGHYTLTKNLSALEIEDDSEYHMLLPKILIAILSLMMVACLALSLSRCRLCFWLKKMLAPRIVGVHSNANGIRRQEAWPGENAVSYSPNLCMTEERSPLYVMKNAYNFGNRGVADAWEVSPRRIKLLKVIGEGNFGVVHLAKLDTKNPDLVAVKKLKENATSDEVNDFLGEIRMLKLVGRHPHVVSLLGCCTLEQPYYALLEYASGGNLHKKLVSLREFWRLKMRTVSKGYSETSSCLTDATSSRMRSSVAETEYTLLSDNGNNYERRLDSSMSLDLPKIGGGSTGSSFGSDTFTDNEDFTISDFKMSPLKQNDLTHVVNNAISIEQILDTKTLHRYALQIAKGMEHLEDNGIVHRDLAARNVLIDSRGDLKISDLGLSRQGIYVPIKQNALPLRWLALEAIKDFYFTSKSDIWAFGVVLWEIGTLGGFPYQSIQNEGIKHYLANGGRLQKPEIVSQSLYEIMLQCWDNDPDKRPTFSDLVRYFDINDEDNSKAYINISSLRQDYVFPPMEELSLISEKRLKDFANNNLKSDKLS